MKYELTNETCEYEGRTLHRIRALKDFGDVKAGDLGGWIESEDNLSQDGNCWVSDDAKVYDGALVSGHARVYGDAAVLDSARVFGSALVSDHARVYGNAEVYGNAKVYDNAQIYGDTQIYGNAAVLDSARVFGDAAVHGDALVCGAAKISGNAEVLGNAAIVGDAVVEDDLDYTTIKNFWSSGRCITYTRSNRMWTTGCFYGTGEELIKKAYVDSEEKGKCYETIVRAVEEIARINTGKGEEG